MKRVTTPELLAIFEKYPTILTDSRRITGGGLFFALKGDNFDGNRFAAQALADGAAYAIIDDIDAAGEDDRFLVVDDVLTALQNLANAYRRTFQIPIIGMTGSNGKTTTKELVAAVLSSHYETHFTRGNFNNHIGVPLTLLSMPRTAAVAVIEMGANHQGEIDLLCRIAEPTHGLITNVGKAHLEGFGGFEGVKKGKSEMYRFLAAHRGTIFINEDEPHLADLAPTHANRVFYRRAENIDSKNTQYELILDATEPFLRVRFQQETVETNLVGKYNFGNIATAIALGRYFKVPADKIKAAIEAYIPANNRSQMIETHGHASLQGAKIILDAYNANPTSVKNAVQNFSEMNFGENSQQKIAILGDMRELGNESQAEHAAMFAFCKTLNVQKWVFVGKEYGKVVETSGDKILHFETTEAAKNWFSEQSHAGVAYLIKGSRGMKLETLLQ